jgi:growth factor-regulated tyrosine kinase substrate
LGQIRDARAALDDLRFEHTEKLRRRAEEQARIKQLQMEERLDVMRQKKQAMLQFQRQAAMQRMQDQEREMQMRIEQQSRAMGQNPYGGYQQNPAGMQGKDLSFLKISFKTFLYRLHAKSSRRVI